MYSWSVVSKEDYEKLGEAKIAWSIIGMVILALGSLVIKRG